MAIGDVSGNVVVAAAEIRHRDASSQRDSMRYSPAMLARIIKTLSSAASSTNTSEPRKRPVQAPEAGLWNPTGRKAASQRPRSRYPPHKCPFKRTLIGTTGGLAALDGQIRSERADDQRERSRGRVGHAAGDAAPPHS